MTPLLHGLVLAGGRSTRMRRDKGTIVYPGRTADQTTRTHELLSRFCADVRISCRPGQPIPPGLAAIRDRHEELGPACGLLSARELEPEAAWLVLACDFPLASAEALERLVQARDSARAGTAFVSPSGFVEPLFAIWEPRGLEALERERDAIGSRLSPRRVLELSGFARVDAGGGEFLANVNTPEELARFSL